MTHFSYKRTKSCPFIRSEKNTKRITYTRPCKPPYKRPTFFLLYDFSLISGQIWAFSYKTDTPVPEWELKGYVRSVDSTIVAAGGSIVGSIKPSFEFIEEAFDKLRLSLLAGWTTFFVFCGAIGRIEPVGGAVAWSTIRLISLQVAPSFRFEFRIISLIWSFNFIFSFFVAFWTFSIRSFSAFNRAFWAVKRAIFSVKSRSRTDVSAFSWSNSLRRTVPERSASRWRATKSHFYTPV